MEVSTLNKLLNGQQAEFTYLWHQRQHSKLYKFDFDTIFDSLK